MKYLKFLILILMAMGIVACNSINKPEDTQDNDFFPLRVGDKFLYRLSPESNFGLVSCAEEVEVRVTRKVDTLGKTYYVIENYFLAGTGFEGITYVRKDENNVYFFAPDEEVLYYRFDPLDYGEYFVPPGIVPNGNGIIPDGGWSIDSLFVITQLNSGENYFTFWIKPIPNFFISSLNYTKFERGKGRTQIFSKGDVGTIIYDLVKRYR